jgi:hypothetical protein
MAGGPPSPARRVRQRREPGPAPRPRVEREAAAEVPGAGQRHGQQERPPPRRRRVAGVDVSVPGAAADLGFGRIVASGIEAPNMLANLV